MSTNDAAHDDAQSETTDADELPSSLELEDFGEGDRILVNYASTHSDERQELTGTVTSIGALSLTVDSGEEYDDGTPKIYEVDRATVKTETRRGHKRRVSQLGTEDGSPAVILTKPVQRLRERFRERFETYEHTKQVPDDAAADHVLMNVNDHIALVDRETVPGLNDVDFESFESVESGLLNATTYRAGPEVYALEHDGKEAYYTAEYVDAAAAIAGVSPGEFEIEVMCLEYELGPILMEIPGTSWAFELAPRIAVPGVEVLDPLE